MMRSVRVTVEVIQDDVVIQENGANVELPKDDFELRAMAHFIGEDVITLLAPHVNEVQLPDYKSD